MKAALAVAASLTLLAAAQAVGAPGGVVHSATGSGHFMTEGQLRTFTFSAIEHADGRVTGQAHFYNRARGNRVHFEVTCLNVVGNTAYMSGPVKNAKQSNEPENASGIWSVQDNGEGAGSPPDKVSFLAIIPASSGVANCRTAAPPPTNTVEEGNVQVR